ncbi:hypothetical protein JOC77_001188 [Peribacillus deserti]|uniref:General stress protein n=1 Tax=Peribacillus deserti TaxID=673318 RepID=A0ABS2QHL8_9BACI|nr:hypothetical protein [Peribacillus deserti]MBM7691781.1 hypothetical protein [Peribacillus deserti]
MKTKDNFSEGAKVTKDNQVFVAEKNGGNDEKSNSRGAASLRGQDK